VKDIIDFYEKPPEQDYAKRHGAGQFYWAPFMYVRESPDLPRYRPSRPIEKLDVTTFDPAREQPDSSAQTDVDEFLGIGKYKLRRVVVLSSRADTWKAYAKSAGELYLIAPVYTLWDKYAERYKYPEEFVAHAIEYRYNSVFYLPRDDQYGVEESIVRLDQVAGMHATWLVNAPRLRLRQEALELLRQWFHYYVTGRLPEELEGEIATYRELVSDGQRNAG